MTFSTLASPGVSLQGGGGSGGGGGGTPGGSDTQLQYNSSGSFAGASGITTNGTNLTLSSSSQLLWSTDLLLTRRGAANLRLGAADAAAPVAQTLSVQSVVAGTSNTAGANLTITGSQGTGTGAGGSIIFQVAPAGSSGTAQNALATALTINGNRSIKLENTGSSVTPSLYWNTSPGVFSNWGFYSPGTGLAGYATANAEVVRFGQVNGVTVYDTYAIGPTIGSPDIFITRDDANKLALRNGANNQELRVYGSYTSASVYDRLTLKSSSTVATIAAETDAGDMDLALTPAGSGNVQFGTHAAVGAETITGYITIKDAGGTLPQAGRHFVTGEPMITITLTQDELTALAGLMDAGIKATGLQGVKSAAALLVKLEAAVAEANAAEPKETE